MPDSTKESSSRHHEKGIILRIILFLLQGIKKKASIQIFSPNILDIREK